MNKNNRFFWSIVFATDRNVVFKKQPYRKIFGESLLADRLNETEDGNRTYIHVAGTGGDRKSPLLYCRRHR